MIQVGLVSAIRKIRNTDQLTEIVTKTSIGYGAKILDAALPGPLRVQWQAARRVRSPFEVEVKSTLWGRRDIPINHYCHLRWPDVLALIVRAIVVTVVAIVGVVVVLISQMQN